MLCFDELMTAKDVTGRIKIMTIYYNIHLSRRVSHWCATAQGQDAPQSRKEGEEEDDRAEGKWSDPKGPEVLNCVEVKQSH